jgi:hypothetical protein
VSGIAPQRQLDQRNDAETHEYLLNEIFPETRGKAASSIRAYQPPSQFLRESTSFLEKRTEAVFANCVSDLKFCTFGSEIAHPHHIDGSLHVILCDRDIKTVVEAGYGERHPIARGDHPLWALWFFVTETRPPVPENLVLVYAPRDIDEANLTMSIVNAGIQYVTADPTAIDDHETCACHHPKAPPPKPRVEDEVPHVETQLETPPSTPESSSTLSGN